MNESEKFLSDEDNVEIVYECVNYVEILHLASRRRFEWNEFKSALIIIGLDYEEMKKVQENPELKIAEETILSNYGTTRKLQAIYDTAKRLEEQRKYTEEILAKRAERLAKNTEDRERQRNLRPINQTLDGLLLEETPVVKHLTVTDILKKSGSLQSSDMSAMKAHIWDLVYLNAEYLKNLKTHRDLYKWAYDHDFTHNGFAFSTFKKALLNLKIDYDSLKRDANPEPSQPPLQPQNNNDDIFPFF